MRQSTMTESEVRGQCKKLGQFSNNWRQRTVEIFEHNTQSGQVISIGTPFDGGEPIIAEEPRGSYWRELKEPEPTYSA